MSRSYVSRFLESKKITLLIFYANEIKWYVNIILHEIEDIDGEEGHA